MTYIPDEAVLRSDEISPSALRLYLFYCLRRNKKTGGWNCSLSQSAAETKMSKSRVSELRAELTAKGWVEIEGSFITPVVGFKGSESRTPGFGISNGTVREIESKGSESRTKGSRSRTLPPYPPNKDYQPITNKEYQYMSRSAVADVAFSSSIPEIQTPVSEQITVEIQPPVEPQISAPIPATTEDEFTLTGEPVAAKPARFKSVLRDKLPVKLQKVLTSQIEADALEVFEFWKEHHGHPNAQFTEQRAKAVVGTLAGGSTKDELLAAVRGAKRSRYHQGENETRTVYDDLELICRNRQKVEQFSAYLGTAKMATAPTAPTRLPAPAALTAPPAPPVTESDIARRIAALTESGTIVTDRPSRIQQTREYYEARMGFAELYRVLATNPDATGLPAVEEVLAFGIEHGVFASNYPEFAQMCREVFGRWLLWQHRNEIAARNAFARALEHPKYVAQVLARYGVSPATHGQEVACA